MCGVNGGSNQNKVASSSTNNNKPKFKCEEKLQAYSKQ